jgi:predicted metal-dependent hydrolase
MRPRGNVLVVPLASLCSAFARSGERDPVASDARIDLARPFLCPTVIPLCYTASWPRLGPEQALRANQITGLCFNELITFFETAFAPAVLAALRRRAIPPELADCLRHFLADEARHSAMFQRLNRLSAPGWYARSPYRLVRVPRAVRAVVRLLTRHPALFPAVLWIMLALEEHSLEVSRRCAGVEADLEPHWARAWRAHFEDEVRHVQVDWHLIERFHAAQPPSMRRANAFLVRTGIARFLLAPSRSGLRVLSALVAEFPELRALEASLAAELVALDRSPAYQSMMYSRQATPLTFELFDRFPEFHDLSAVLAAYRPEAGS